MLKEEAVLVDLGTEEAKEFLSRDYIVREQRQSVINLVVI